MSSSSSDDDDDDVPLGQLRNNNKRATKVVEPTTVSSSSTGGGSGGSGSRSSTGGSRKRPNYREDSDGDDGGDEENFASPSSPSPPAKKKKNKNKTTTPKVKIIAVKKEEKATKTAVKREGDSKSPASTKNGGAIEKKKKNGDKKKVDKKPPSSSSSSSSSKMKETGGAGGMGGGTANVLKAMEKSERISHGMQAHLWWDAPDPPEGCQWSEMEHAGVSFPEPYVPHGVPLTYDGREVRLDPNEEEAATFFAAMDPDGMHLGNPRTAPIFARNFMADFRSVLGGGGRAHVRDFDKCDFGPMRRHLEEQKLVRRAITDGERRTNKGAKDAAMFRFGYALVDGHLEKVGNYNSE